MWLGMQGRDAVEAESGNSSEESVTPDGSAEVLAGVFFISSRGGGGRGSAAANDACRVKRSDRSRGSSGESGESGNSSEHHAGGGCGDHLWVMYKVTREW